LGFPLYIQNILMGWGGLFRDRHYGCRLRSLTCRRSPVVGPSGRDCGSVLRLSPQRGHTANAADPNISRILRLRVVLRTVAPLGGFLWGPLGGPHCSGDGMNIGRQKPGRVRVGPISGNGGLVRYQDVSGDIGSMVISLGCKRVSAYLMFGDMS